MLSINKNFESANQRLGLFYLNQSEISKELHQPIRAQYLPDLVQGSMTHGEFTMKKICACLELVQPGEAAEAESFLKVITKPELIKGCKW